MDSLRILIAEDDSLVALDLAEQLESLGHTVVGSAATGRQAVRLARKLLPDLITMDIKMPELDGLAAAREVTAERPVPIIVLTGHGETELIEEADDVGILAYLIKPVDPRELAAALRIATSRFQEFQDLHRQVSDLQEALETRKLVERAKGILMTRKNLSEAEAYAQMRQASQDQNKRLADIARAIIAADSLL
jgi:response regulator NasT